MKKKPTCATLKGRALLLVLSSFCLGVVNTNAVYAYTVDDVREFVGDPRKNTIENRTALSQIVYQYGQQEKRKDIVEQINSNTLGENILDKYTKDKAILDGLNAEIGSAFEEKDAMEIIALYKDAIAAKEKVNKYNLSDIHYRASDGALTLDDYNYAMNELEKANEAFEVGDIGNKLNGFLSSEALEIVIPYGDSLKDTMSGEVIHSNGVYVKSFGKKSEVKNLLNGVVEKIVDSEDWGKYLVIKHGENLTSSISFMDSIDVSVGEVVNQYDVIGNAGGVVYLEFILDGKYIDPVYLLGSNGVRAYNKWVSQNSELVINVNDYTGVKDRVDTYVDGELSVLNDTEEYGIKTEVIE